MCHDKTQTLIIHTDAIFNDYTQVSETDAVSILIPATQHGALARDTKANGMMPFSFAYKESTQ